MIYDSRSADGFPAFRRSNSTSHHQGMSVSQKAEKRCCCNVCRSLYVLEYVFLHAGLFTSPNGSRGRREAVKALKGLAFKNTFLKRKLSHANLQ